MKKGGDAGASKVREVASPPGAELTAPAPIRPQMIEGRVDNGKEPIALKAIRSWGSDAKYGFMLALSGNPKLNQPTARVLLSYPTAAPIIVEIQYTVAQNMVAAINANPVAKTRFDGVAVEVSSDGGMYKTSALLKIDPERPDQRRWLSTDVVLPAGTTELDFWIAGVPPRYQVFWDNCLISLPQLQFRERLSRLHLPLPLAPLNPDMLVSDRMTDASSFPPRAYSRARMGTLYLGGVARFILLLLPSLWLLTQPFAWLGGLEAMALGTVIPIVVFGLVGCFCFVCRDEEAVWLEWAAITLCFVCLQAYIYNTALHPANRFNLLGGLLPNADPAMYLSLASQWERGVPSSNATDYETVFPLFSHRDAVALRP